ncbi:MAG: hypothetical protein R3F20_01135 [Planctomycetota bacterium]
MKRRALVLALVLLAACGDRPAPDADGGETIVPAARLAAAPVRDAAAEDGARRGSSRYRWPISSRVRAAAAPRRQSPLAPALASELEALLRAATVDDPEVAPGAAAERLEIRRVELTDPTPGVALVFRARAKEPRGRIVVVGGRLEDLGDRDCGSRVVGVANALQIARALAFIVTDGRQPHDFGVDVEVHFVSDGGRGWDYLAEVPGRGPLWGVIALGDLPAEDAGGTDLVVALGAIDGLVERAVAEAAVAYAGQPSRAWNAVGFDSASSGPSEALARRLGQARIPFATVERGRRGEARALRAPPGLALGPKPIDRAPGSDPDAGSDRDTPDAVDPRHAGPVAVARLVLIALVRAAGGAS